MKHKQRGVIKGDLIGILLGGVALGGLLIYGAVSGQPLPVWPAIAVVVVNVVAAVRVFLGVKRAKQQRQAQSVVNVKTPL